MTKLLLNAGSTPIYNIAGGPIPAGGIALDDELPPEHEALYDDGTLVYVRPSDVPADLADAHLSAAAEKHVIEWRGTQGTPRGKRGGNADATVSDDAGVSDPTDKGGNP